MKLVRIWLLVLLATLLPVRGALAATMLCAPAIGSQGHAHGAADHHGHGEAHAGDEAAAHHQQEDGGAHDKCSLCASCCATATPPSIASAVSRVRCS